jgi:glutamate carboxypeptidase
MRLLLPAFLLLAATSSSQAQLTETEQRIVAAVKERSPAALELLERTARVNSGTLNVPGVREVGRLFREEFDALGLRTRWAEMPPEMKRAGHLVASREGSKGKRLLLIGHLDTVFEPASAVATWDRRGDRVRGQGVADMKGGDVIVVEALRALQRVGALEDTTIHVIFTGDEERSGAPREVARKDLVDLAKASDLALAFEASQYRGGHYYASFARRSSGGFTLRVTARAGHGGGVFSDEDGNGAIYEAARILNEFREKVAEPNLTFNPGVILGGTDVRYDGATAGGTASGKSNVIAREAIVASDMRYLDPAQGERAKARMREIVAASLPFAKATITFRESYPPQPPTAAGEQLLKEYSRASEDAGLGPVLPLDPALRGAGDVQFAAPYIPGIDGLGTLGTGGHTDDEDMEIASLERGTIRAALLIYRLTR